ncbi:hypothetical protein EV363DRAFT_721440 [Boletus edulis]|nr:hypothetical protein EV363DRAFT_721440 [Boletus edulis]
MADSNSLGLDFEKETATEETTTEQVAEQETKPEKKKPYVNLERVKTGGPQREKPSEEELAERMQRIKEQNEKIKQRRLRTRRRSRRYKRRIASSRRRCAKCKKASTVRVNRTRGRKMDKMGAREWDSGKPTGEGAVQGDAVKQEGKPGRGGARGRGRGRGRRGVAPSTTTTTTTTDVHV